MKKIFVITMLLLFTLQAQALTANEYWAKRAYLGAQNRNLDPLYTLFGDVDGILGSSGELSTARILFTEETGDPTATEGTLYYNASSEVLRLRKSGSWVNLAVGSGTVSLNVAYGNGVAITVDNGAVALTATNAADNTVLQVIQDDTGTALGVDINNAGTGNSIDIQNAQAGTDIEGTDDTWNVATTGVGTFLSFVLENGGVINNTTNNEIEFIENSEQFSFAFNGNTLTYATDSGIDAIDFGVVDALSGINSIAFDGAVANTITQTATGGADDLTIAQAGAVDASLILTSEGTGADALSLITSNAAGDIKVSSSDNIDVDAADDITIDTAGGSITTTLVGGDFALDATNASITLDAGEAATDAIVFVAAAGGIDADTALSISFKSTENTADSIELVSTAGGIDITAAGATDEDIDIVCTAGSVNITAGENHIDAMILKVDKGASETLQILAIKGTGASAATQSDASIQLESTVGGIGLLSLLNGDNAIRLEANGGTDENIFIHSNQGTGADSITLLSDAGGIAVTASAGSVVVTATGAASDITLSAGDVMTLTSVDTKIFDGAAAETWIIEGTANDFEAIVVFTDPTADITWTFPAGVTDTLAIMGSTLATNLPEVVNSVTGGSNTLIFEGTADDFETIVTANDATADATISLPNDTGDVVYAAPGTVDYAAGAGALPITHVSITYASQGGGEALTIPDGVPGQILHVNHDTDGGEGNITPDTATGYATVELDDDGDMVTFMFVDTVGWIIIGTAGVAAPPVITL